MERIADPDIVFVALGTNDTLSNDQVTATAKQVEGLRILFSQLRAALPEAAIGIVLNGFPGEEEWARHVPFVRHVLEVYGGREAEGVFVLPVYMVVDPTTVADGIHPNDVGARNGLG
jgi:lysophospholipase L1-like esterase